MVFITKIKLNCVTNYFFSNLRLLSLNKLNNSNKIKMSKTQIRHAHMASNFASKSDLAAQRRHGVVVVKNGKPVFGSCNSRRTYCSFQDLPSINACSIHAEISAIRRLLVVCKKGKERQAKVAVA